MRKRMLCSKRTNRRRNGVIKQGLRSGILRIVPKKAIAATRKDPKTEQSAEKNPSDDRTPPEKMKAISTSGCSFTTHRGSPKSKGSVDRSVGKRRQRKGRVHEDDRASGIQLTDRADPHRAPPGKAPASFGAPYPRRRCVLEGIYLRKPFQTQPSRLDLDLAQGPARQQPSKRDPSPVRRVRSPRAQPSAAR